MDPHAVHADLPVVRVLAVFEAVQEGRGLPKESLTSLELIPIPKIDKANAMTILGMCPQKPRESLRSAPR